MSFWAKIIGGVAGMAVAGPFGAVLGAALGHAADSGGLGREGLLDTLRGGLFGGGGGEAAGLSAARVATLFGRREEVFALCVVVLSAKLAKCDGPVNRAEIDAFKRTFRTPPEAARDIGKLFDRARASTEGYQGYATQLGDSFADSPDMLEDVLRGLVQIARADRALNQPELRFLQGVAQRLNLGRDAWERAIGPAARAVPPAREMTEDAYAVLGAARSSSDDELRSRWVGLMRQNHPDSLASQGASPERLARASDVVARINAAWDSIKRERGL